MNIPPDIEQAGPVVAGFYEYLVDEKGQSETIAAMLSLRQAPRVMTDDVMMSGIGTLADQFKHDPKALDYITKAAMRRGYTPKPTDFYCASAADGMGDPEAFLNHGQGRGHLRRLYKRRGWSGQGLVDVKGREPEHDPHEPRYKLHPEIVENVRKRMIRENPNLARQDQTELRAAIIEKHGPSTE